MDSHRWHETSEIVGTEAVRVGTKGMGAAGAVLSPKKEVDKGIASSSYVVGERVLTTDRVGNTKSGDRPAGLVHA